MINLKHVFWTWQLQWSSRWFSNDEDQVSKATKKPSVELYIVCTYIVSQCAWGEGGGVLQWALTGRAPDGGWRYRRQKWVCMIWMHLSWPVILVPDVPEETAVNTSNEEWFPEPSNDYKSPVSILPNSDPLWLRICHSYSRWLFPTLKIVICAAVTSAMVASFHSFLVTMVVLIATMLWS